MEKYKSSQQKNPFQSTQKTQQKKQQDVNASTSYNQQNPLPKKPTSNW
ncbi:MAG: hypothetical protein ACK5MA_08855 [Parachlamydiaceae bacterium]